MTNTVDTAKVEQMLAEGAQVVEVLPSAEYEEEHLPGALSIPLSEMTRDGVGGLDPDRPVVVYCFDFQ
ncbi:MAG: rhodanese-like domain-containing protein [Actinobacteria bacterium]|nr:rhodanese-like domain-containing protein [Actinomycetota bacterium]